MYCMHTYRLRLPRSEKTILQRSPKPGQFLWFCPTMLPDQYPSNLAARCNTTGLPSVATPFFMCRWMWWTSQRSDFDPQPSSKPVCIQNYPNLYVSLFKIISLVLISWCSNFVFRGFLTLTSFLCVVWRFRWHWFDASQTDHRADCTAGRAPRISRCQRKVEPFGGWHTWRSEQWTKAFPVV